MGDRGGVAGRWGDAGAVSGGCKSKVGARLWSRRLNQKTIAGSDLHQRAGKHDLLWAVTSCSWGG